MIMTFGDEMMKEFEVWMEGYCATGDKEPAALLGSVFAKDFKRACDVICGENRNYNSWRLTVWGCKLFDNEDDARKGFG